MMIAFRNCLLLLAALLTCAATLAQDAPQASDAKAAKILEAAVKTASSKRLEAEERKRKIDADLDAELQKVLAETRAALEKRIDEIRAAGKSGEAMFKSESEIREIMSNLEARVGSAAQATSTKPDDASGVRLPRNWDFSQGATAGWNHSGASFLLREHGTSRTKILQSHVPPSGSTNPARDGDAATGEMWQEFMVAGNAATISGRVWGGPGGRIELWRGPDLLQSAQGNMNSVDMPGRSEAVEFLWRIETERGNVLRIKIVDDSDKRWGWVALSNLKLD